MAVRVLVVGDRGRLSSWVVLPLAGFLVAGSAATFAAHDPVISLSGLIRFTQLFVVVPLATYLAIESKRDLKLILGTVLALGVLEGAIGVYQFVSGTGAGFAGSTVRAVGTFGAYEVMGMAIVVTYAVIAAAAIYVGLSGRRRWWGLLLAVALCFPLAFSLSRGFWIAAAVGVVAVLALSDLKKAVPFVVAGMLALIILINVTSGSSGVLAERFSSLFCSSCSEPDQSIKDRYALWGASLDMWTDHPLTGVGIKNFAYFRDTYVPLSFAGSSGKYDVGGGFRYAEILSPHNMYLLVLAEQGLLGILAYLVLFLSLGVAALRRLGSLRESPTERVFGLSSLGFLASFMMWNVYSDVGGATMVLDSVILGGLVWLASGAKLAEEAS
jgi:O-antigen ligase